MSQPVQGGSGETFAAEHLRPVLERQVRRHDQAQPFIRCADHVEQQLRPHLAGGDIAQFIQDQQVQPLELLLQFEQRPFTGMSQFSKGRA